jgi:hypothetical protein
MCKHLLYCLSLSLWMYVCVCVLAIIPVSKKIDVSYNAPYTIPMSYLLGGWKNNSHFLAANHLKTKLKEKGQ